MTAQINDSVFHSRIKYGLAGISGEGLFAPDQIGLQTSSVSTACWRGYVCEYEVADNQLFLNALYLGIKGEGPEIFGKQPTPISGHCAGNVMYQGIHQPIAYTGGLLLANDFIPSLYVHMGFHPAWKYKKVLELIFEGGRLLEEHDRSAEMKEFRDRSGQSPENHRPSPADRKALEEWIERCFSRRY